MSSDLEYEDDDSSPRVDSEDENPTRLCVRRLLSFSESRRPPSRKQNNRYDSNVDVCPAEYEARCSISGSRKVTRKSTRHMVKKALFSRPTFSSNYFAGVSHNDNAKCKRKTAFTHCFNTKDCANNALAKALEKDQVSPVMDVAEKSCEELVSNELKPAIGKAAVQKKSSQQSLGTKENRPSSSPRDENKFLLETECIKKCDPETKAKIRKEVARCMKEEIQRAKACVSREANRMRRYFENTDNKTDSVSSKTTGPGNGKQINIDPRSERYLQTLDQTLRKHCMEGGKCPKSNHEKRTKYSDEAIIDEVHKCQEIPQGKRITTFNCANMMGKSKYPKNGGSNFQLRKTGYVWSDDNPRILKRDRPWRVSRPVLSLSSARKRDTSETSEAPVPRSISQCATRLGSRAFSRNLSRKKVSKSWSPPRMEIETFGDTTKDGNAPDVLTKTLLRKKRTRSVGNGDGDECLIHRQLKILETLPDYITLKETRALIKSVVNIIGRRLKTIGFDKDTVFSENTQTNLQYPSPSSTMRSNSTEEWDTGCHEITVKNGLNVPTRTKTANATDSDYVTSGLSSLSSQPLNTKSSIKTLPRSHCSNKEKHCDESLKESIHPEQIATPPNGKGLKKQASRRETRFNKSALVTNLKTDSDNRDSSRGSSKEQEPSDGGTAKQCMCSSNISDPDSCTKYDRFNRLEYGERQNRHTGIESSSSFWCSERKEQDSLSKRPFKRYLDIHSRQKTQENWASSSTVDPAATEITSHSESAIFHNSGSSGYAKGESTSSSALTQEAKGCVVKIAPNMRAENDGIDLHKDDVTCNNALHSHECSSQLLSNRSSLVPCPHGISQNFVASKEDSKVWNVKGLKACGTNSGEGRESHEEIAKLSLHELPKVASLDDNDKGGEIPNQSINQRSTDEIDLDALSCSPETAATSTSLSRRLMEINSKSIDTSLEEWKSRSTREFVRDLSDFRPAPYERVTQITGGNEVKIPGRSSCRSAYTLVTTNEQNPRGIVLDNEESQSNVLHLEMNSHSISTDSSNLGQSINDPVPQHRFSVVKGGNPMTGSRLLHSKNRSVETTSPFLRVLKHGDGEQSPQSCQSHLISDHGRTKPLQWINNTVCPTAMSPNTAMLNEVKSKTDALLHEAQNRSSFDCFAQSMMHIDQPDLSRAIDLVENFSPIKPADINTPYPTIRDRRSKTVRSPSLDRQNKLRLLSLQKLTDEPHLNAHKSIENVIPRGSVTNITDPNVVVQSDINKHPSSASDHTLSANSNKNDFGLERKPPLSQRLASRKESALIDVTNGKQAQRPVIIKTYRPHSAIPVVLKSCDSKISVRPTTIETIRPRSTSLASINLVDTSKSLKEPESHLVSHKKLNNITSSSLDTEKNQPMSKPCSSLSYTICSNPTPKKAGTFKHIGQTFRYQPKEREYVISNKSLTSVTSDDSLTDKNMSFNDTKNDTSEWNYSENNNNRADRDTVIDDHGCGATWYCSEESCESGSDRAERAEEADKHRPSSKILGELAFQLERRILDYVFGAEDSKRRRFYGYTVNNICSMVNKESKVSGGDDGVIKKGEMSNRLNKLLQALKKHSYKIKVHGDFAQKMINKYGLLQSPPDTCTVDSFGLNDANTIAGLISELACGPYEAQNFNILLKSLQYMSKCDGRPLFVW